MAKALIIHGELRALVSCRVSSGPSAGWGCGAAALWGEWGQPQMRGEAGDSEVRFWQGEKISSSFLLGIRGEIPRRFLLSGSVTEVC